ncbi:MAG: purine-nucleoside phosphorylase, partial [Actinomycetota bacterium]|nr:purine-nucleoside phosphorylase [Actinomycetota bacterium]
MNLSDRLGGLRPRVLLTLGSGLGALAEEITDPLILDFPAIGLPAPTVSGHAGRLVAGELAGIPLLVQQGRVHLYEGVAVRDVTACVRAAADAGVETFVVTNAAGGLRADLEPGDLLAITDHLNLSGANPLIGRGGAPAFVDMKDAYDPR